MYLPKEIHNNGAIMVNGWYLRSGGRETYIFSFADIDVISWVVSSGGALFLTIKNTRRSMLCMAELEMGTSLGGFELRVYVTLILL
jgi:hypothetical protein